MLREDGEYVVQPLEISPHIVRDIAQARAEAADFRERFPQSQPELSEFIEEQLEDASRTALAFTQGVAAALWAMYEAHLGVEPPQIKESSVHRFYPIAQQLLENLRARHPDDEDFDAEWLAELPRGAQPHVMGFLLGALRASRFNLSGPEILQTAAILFAIAGSLEERASARKTRESAP